MSLVLADLLEKESVCHKACLIDEFDDVHEEE